MNTPTPWVLNKGFDDGTADRPLTHLWSIYAESGPYICEFGKVTEEHAKRHAADAALIVRAVNSHQSLIDALSEAVNLFRGGDLTNEQAHALWKADAALALAKEPT